MHFGNEGVQCFKHIGTFFVLELKVIAHCYVIFTLDFFSR
jgi:hypothetical protein